MVIALDEIALDDTALDDTALETIVDEIILLSNIMIPFNLKAPTYSNTVRFVWIIPIILIYNH